MAKLEATITTDEAKEQLQAQSDRILELERKLEEVTRREVESWPEWKKASARRSDLPTRASQKGATDGE